MSETFIWDQHPGLLEAAAMAVKDALEPAVGSVTLVMYAVHDDTGQVANVSQLGPEQMGEFLKYALAQHRAGAYTVEEFARGGKQ